MGGGGGVKKTIPLANIKEEDYEGGACGFTASECEELLQQGKSIKSRGFRVYWIVLYIFVNSFMELQEFWTKPREHYLKYFSYSSIYSYTKYFQE